MRTSAVVGSESGEYYRWNERQLGGGDGAEMTVNS